METVASRGRQWRRKLEEEVPVHGDGDGAFVVLPGGVQVRPRQVGGIKSPSRLCRRKPSGIVHPGMARITPEFINTKSTNTKSYGMDPAFCLLLGLVSDKFGLVP